MNVYIHLEETYIDKIEEVVQNLVAKGFVLNQVMAKTGVITGSVSVQALYVSSAVSPASRAFGKKNI